jgi:hypothetical protein
MLRPSLLLIALFLTTGQAAGAEPLGRLFFTPAERAALDQERAQKAGGTAVSSHGQVSLSGYVRRSSGKTTAWINAVPQHEDSPSAGARPAANQVPIHLPSGRQVTLKPGQRYDPASGTIREGYQTAPAEPRQP